MNHYNTTILESVELRISENPGLLMWTVLVQSQGECKGSDRVIPVLALETFNSAGEMGSM
jgi:hypothetical protein